MAAAAGLGVALLVGSSTPVAAQDPPPEPPQEPTVTVDEQAERDGDGYVFTGTLVCGEDSTGEDPELVLLAWQGTTVVGGRSEDVRCGEEGGGPEQDENTWSVTISDEQSEEPSADALQPGEARVFVMVNAGNQLLMEQGDVTLN